MYLQRCSINGHLRIAYQTAIKDWFIQMSLMGCLVLRGKGIHIQLNGESVMCICSAAQFKDYDVTAVRNGPYSSLSLLGKKPLRLTETDLSYLEFGLVRDGWSFVVVSRF